jgi:hypothetical protein
MRFAEEASRSNIFATFWTADNIIRLFLDLAGYQRNLALRVTWRSFGNTTVYNSPLWYDYFPGVKVGYTELIRYPE